MRHFVNLALVPFFLTLVVTGLMRFLLPFSLITTRIHIIFGFGVIVLVGLHLVSRLTYFKNIVKSANNNDIRRRHISNRTLTGVLSLWLFLVATSFWGVAPVSQIISASYESKNRAIIFRPDPQTVFKPVQDGMRLKRATDSDADLLIELDWGSEIQDFYGRSSSPFEDSRPQMAIWAESQTGTLIETLFLSEKVAFNETLHWGGQEQRRVDILPIWRNRFTLTTGIAPDGEQAAFYSGATPEHSFSIQNYLKTDSKPFYLYVEINAPEDSNDFFNSDKELKEEGYTKPGIGQPSVLYGAYVRPQKEKQYLLLDLIGHGGSSSTNDGSIHYDNEKLTSAKKIIEKILARIQSIEPEETEVQTESD